MVLTREKKNDTSNQNRERCFFTCEKNDTSNQKPQRCVSFELFVSERKGIWYSVKSHCLSNVVLFTDV